MDDILVVKGVCKSFGALRALNNVSLSVNQGDIFGIAGPNGSGKSTLFNVITSVPYTADSGVVLFEGKEIQGKSPHKICRFGIARTFQRETAFDTLTTRDNARLGAVYGTPTLDEAKRWERTQEALAYVGMAEDQFDRLAAELSVFDKKRLMLASALATAPKVLLMDEPASGLTGPEIDETIELIRRVNDSGVTILVIEHVLPLLLNVSHKLMVLNQGEPLTVGTPDEVVRNPLVIEAYLGTQKR